jgi:hypothetical protein
MSVQLYGTALNWSTLNSPKPCGGIAENYTYRDSYANVGEVEDEDLELAAVALTGQFGDISFDGTVTDDTTDLPDLSEGAKIAITGLATGTVLLTELVERWAINQAKTFNARASHFPKVVGGSGASAGSFSGVSPTQTVAPIIRPGGKVVWGTKGLTSSLGIVQSLVITQSLKLSPEMDEAGDTVFVAASGYRRRIQLEVLALAAQSAPALNATLTVGGAPAHGSGAFNVSVERKFTKGKGVIYTVDGLWAPNLDL